MSIQRWGAFSVIDHKDARTLAAEVLLYDHLLIPTPVEADRFRWAENGWDPEQLDKRLKQLGDIAIPAPWDQTLERKWQDQFDLLSEQVRGINGGYETSRSVLAKEAWRYRPEGVSAIEAFSAWQSEADFQAAEAGRGADRTNQMGEFNFLVAQRILIPDEEEPEESLRRALHLADKQDYRNRRTRFHQWQHEILARGIMPGDAAGEISNLVAECNDAVQSAGRRYRVETAMLAGSLSGVALATVAGLAPGLFIGIGIGVLTGAQVVSLGAAATGAVLQIARHVSGRPKPASANGEEISGAMFHQIEEETGWQIRSGGAEVPQAQQRRAGRPGGDTRQ